MRTKPMLVAAAAAAGTLLAPSAALAAKPPTAKALEPFGLTATWPVRGAKAEVAAGAKLTVSLRRGARAPKARRASARVTLLRLAGAGAPARTVTTRPLRGGTGRVTVRLPAAKGVSYALRLKVRGKLFASRLNVPAARPVTPEPSPAPPAPDPAPAPEPAPPFTPVIKPPACPSGTAEVTHHLWSDVIVETSADLTLRNSGTGCLRYTWSFTIERKQEDGSWTEVPSGVGFLAVVRLLQPGETVRYDWKVPDETPPGRYRLVPNRFHPADDGAPIAAAPREFTVTH
ncbi:immunoglobulin-like domain-containing protein [Conexibacter arvalis]|uniref:Bacterial Ig-like domain-containing protein n=1 Tax=Conexibacter arvalis TaxID=912552 RepID=A0A840II78_9ACTN|nr:immunoglobulin-like domain-containing protein [Conexibacter arvalis]MBB4664025.1 hypothetical protein [Conexibacter arvalis]